jgi:CyaY protein
MEQRDFETRATAALEAISHALDEIEVDFELKEGGVLEMEFDDRSKIIVNRHAAAREIWVAARTGGFHFRWDGVAWRDTRNGAELFAALSELVSGQLGRGVRLLG